MTSNAVKTGRTERANQWDDTIFDLIISVYGGLDDGVDMLAEDAGVTRRAAQNWLNRVNAPRARHLLQLSEVNTAFRQGYMAIFDRMINSG